MKHLLNLVAVSGLLLSSVGCCCLSGGGYGACYPPAGACPGGACGVGVAPNVGVAQREFYTSYSTAQAVIPGAYTTTTSGPVALGPIITSPVTYSVPATTTTFITTPATTAALQPLPTY